MLTLDEILYNLEFDYKFNDDDELQLIDLQGANLGNIEEEAFTVNDNIAMILLDRLENYLFDYYINGYVNTLTYECNEVLSFDYNLEEVLKLMKRHLNIFDKDSIELMECLINPTLIDISNILESKAIKFKCPKCNNRLKKSMIPNYSFTCLECDEDFYTFEVDTRMEQ